MKDEARRMLAQHTASPPTDEKELDFIISGVATTLRPHGLKSLRAEKSSNNPAEIRVIAKASPEEQVAKVSLLKPEIDKYLPKHGTKLAGSIKDHWWKEQLKETKAWDSIGVLDKFEDSAIEYLRESATHENLKGYFDPTKNGGTNRIKSAEADSFKQYALHQLDPNPNHSTRPAFYEKAGDAAVEKLKAGANSATTTDSNLNDKLTKLRFGADSQYGRFSSLPVAKREVDPRLKAASGGGRILKFLKEMAAAWPIRRPQPVRSEATLGRKGDWREPAQEMAQG